MRAGAVLLLLLVGCEPEVLTTTRLSVPNTDNWTCSVELVRDFTTGDQDYTRTGPEIEWSYVPDENGYTRLRGFCQFPLDSLTVPASRIRGCTLGYYIDDMDTLSPADIRLVAVDIPGTSDGDLYLDGVGHDLVGQDSAPALGWRRIALNADGANALKENLTAGTGRIGYCWDLPGSSERAAIAVGNDDTLRPYLVVVYADTAR
jgi:hypothetical protein